MLSIRRNHTSFKPVQMTINSEVSHNYGFSLWTDPKGMGQGVRVQLFLDGGPYGAVREIR